METISNNIKEVIALGIIIGVCYLAIRMRSGNDIPESPGKKFEFPSGAVLTIEGHFKRRMLTGVAIVITLLTFATCISKNVEPQQNSTQTTIQNP